MKLIKDAILKTELNFFDNLLNYFSYLKNENEHYRLLTYISYLYDNELIIDAGTCQGHSCFALSQNKNNLVYTYDIDPKDITYITENYKNVTKKILDINLETDEILESAKIILLDIDPHNGTMEKIFYDKLLSTKFNGFLICDDINLNGGMINFWNSIDKEKYDISEIGHWSGTGIVNFSTEKIEIIL
jgi:tRNA G37 N-methylase Trm5